jgi:DNA invertase Pin-like site-specific DNA recombinase
MTRPLLVARVSTVDQGQDPENQLGPLRDVAHRLGWQIAGELPLKLSAWDAKEAKKVWEAVLEKLQETRADTLMVWATDRIYREKADGIFARIEYLEKHLGISYYSLQEPFLNTGTDPHQRELLLFIAAWLANWESRHRSERLLAAAERRRHRAGDQGRAAWGRGKMPTVSDHEAAMRLRASGRTYRAIAGDLGLSLGVVHKLVHAEDATDG